MGDLENSPRWDFTPGVSGEVDQHLGIVHAREWKRILNAAPYYRTAQRTPTTDSNGQVALTTLSDVSVPDSAENRYRILLVAANNVPYKEVFPEDAFLSNVSGASSQGASRIWYRNGNYLVLPDAPSITLTGVWVNHYPTRADNLSGDGIQVEFPDDYEDILVYMGAASLVGKGAAETDAAAWMQQQAKEMRDDMLQDLARTSIKPEMIRFSDSPGDWAA